MTEQPRKWRFRLTLRTIMLLVLVLGLTLGWKANRARTQRRAVEAIKAVNGTVIYDFQYPGDDVLTSGIWKPNTEPNGPKWLRKLVGDEYFQEVTMVVFQNPVAPEILPSVISLDRLVALSINMSKLDNTSLATIVTAPRLRFLTLSYSRVDDRDVVEIAKARQLERLAIHGASGITDQGMTPLSTLPDLKHLTVMGAPKLSAIGLKNLGPRLAELDTLIVYQTDLSDEGMDCLDVCRKLKVLSLSSAKFGDTGFAHFRNMESLEKLIIGSTNVTDNGLVALQGLKNLKSLSLAKTKITGKGLANLEMMDKLESLMLQGSEVADDGIDSIKKMKGLKYLGLEGTKVSPNAIALLQADRPSLKVSSGPMPIPRIPGSPASPAAGAGK